MLKENWTSKEQTIPTAQLMVVLRAQMTVILKVCYSVERRAAKRAPTTVQMKAYCSVESLAVMRAVMMVQMKVRLLFLAAYVVVSQS